MPPRPQRRRRRRTSSSSAVAPRPEFVGFTIGQGFVVGYGIDYAEQYRGLRDIRVLV